MQIGYRTRKAKFRAVPDLDGYERQRLPGDELIPKMPNLIWELFGDVGVFQIRQQGRHRRFQRRQILLGEIPQTKPSRTC